MRAVGDNRDKRDKSDKSGESGKSATPSRVGWQGQRWKGFRRGFSHALVLVHRCQEALWLLLLPRHRCCCCRTAPKPPHGLHLLPPARTQVCLPPGGGLGLPRVQPSRATLRCMPLGFACHRLARTLKALRGPRCGSSPSGCW